MQVNLNNVISNQEMFEQNIYMMLKGKSLEILDYSRHKFSNDEIIAAIKNAVSIEKEMEAILPKYTNMRALISLGEFGRIIGIIDDVSRLIKGIVPVMTLLDIEERRNTISSKIYEIETLEEMLDFIAKLQDFMTYFSPEEIDQAIENHSWSEEERSTLNNILLKDDIATTPKEEEIDTDKVMSKEILLYLVKADKFLGINEQVRYLDRIEALEHLLTFNKTKIRATPGIYTAVLDKDNKFITVYNQNGDKLNSFTLDGTLTSGDAALENLLKLGY